MELQTGQQTMESHVEEFEIYFQGGKIKRLLMALTRDINLSNFHSGYSDDIVENEREANRRQEDPLRSHLNASITN